MRSTVELLPETFALRAR